MIEITLAVKGRSDVILLRRLLSELMNCSFRYYAGEGRVSLATLGRNILVHEGCPLMIVEDVEDLRRGTQAQKLISAVESLASAAESTVLSAQEQKV